MVSPFIQSEESINQRKGKNSLQYKLLVDSLYFLATTACLENFFKLHSTRQIMERYIFSDAYT